MGILNGKHVFASKFITAIIIDESRRSFFVPIEKPIGSYFLAKLGNEVYAFKVNDRIYTYRHTLAKTFQFTIYFTTHYNPISDLSDDIKLMLKKNTLPRINSPFAKFLKFLGHLENHQEGKEFTPHNLTEIVKTLKTEKNPSPELTNLITFIENLPVNEIVTPVRSLSDFIEDDLKATDPKYLGSLSTALTATDFEHRKITNTPVTAKKPITKLMAVVLLFAMVGFSVYILYDEGYLDDIIPGGGDGSGGALDGLIPGLANTPYAEPTVTEQLMDKYSNPNDLKRAVESGEIPLSSLPDDIQKLLEDIELPDEIPIP